MENIKEVVEFYRVSLRQELPNEVRETFDILCEGDKTSIPNVEKYEKWFLSLKKK